MNGIARHFEAAQAIADVDQLHDALRGDVEQAARVSELERNGERDALLAAIAEDVRRLREAVPRAQRAIQEPELRARLDGAAPGLERYAALAAELAPALFQDRVAALARLDAFETAYGAVKPELDAITRQVDAAVRASEDAGEGHGGAAIRNIAVVTFLAAALIVVLSVAMTSTIARRLAAAVRVASRVVSGDLTAHADLAATGDEIGALQRALGEMVEKLRQVIGEVRSGADALGMAASQVSTTSQALSQGTGEQAASVEETTSSLEEMAASITQNAENSRQTEQMAKAGATDAEQTGT